MTGINNKYLKVCDLANSSGFKLKDKGDTAIQHTWVTVVNPSNKRLLLQACDDCGVVKSENSVVKPCRAQKGQALISAALRATFQLVS